jgi:hypothetical protein
MHLDNGIVTSTVVWNKKVLDFDLESRLSFFNCEIDIFMDGIFHSQTQGMRKAINVSTVVFYINCLKIIFNNIKSYFQAK